MTVLAWFLWRRWLFKAIVKSVGRPSDNLLTGFHNLNVDGCRKHPVIYNDMCRIVRGGK